MEFIQDYDSSFSSSSSHEVEEEKDEEGGENGKITCNWHASTKIVPWDHEDDESRRDHSFQRNQPHVTGNWSGHVYLNLDDDEHGTDLVSGDHMSILKDVIVHMIYQFEREMNSQRGIQNDDDPSSSQVRSILDSKKCECQQDERQGELVIVSHVPLSTVQQTIAPFNNESGSDSRVEDTKDCQASQLHISLSRPFYIQNQSIESFVADLQKYIQTNILHPIVVRIPVYVANAKEDEGSIIIMSTVDTEILTNDEKTRSFLTLPILKEPPSVVGLDVAVQQSTTYVSGMHSIIKLVDKVMEKYGQKVYYQDPKFHISIASWKYNENVIDQWEKRKQIDKIDWMDDQNTATSRRRMMLTFILRGIHCDFGGKAKRYWIPFGK
jgi:Uncharacterised conserved protein.